MIKIDIHQHLWTEPLVQALTERRDLPFVRREHGLTVLFLTGERPYVIDLSNDAPTRRAALVELDGLDRALLCISSPLGIESLPREESLPLIDAYHDGVLSLDGPFGVWGRDALDRPDPDDAAHRMFRHSSPEVPESTIIPSYRYSWSWARIVWDC
jgi:6-methylsalicylate decarboxylase